MKLVVTIDTEEDNWARYSATVNTLENIKRIPQLQAVFDKYEIRPTYLVTYPVATNHYSIQALKKILERDKCEIGMHCHPWNTPPLNKMEKINNQDTMLWHHSSQVIREKLTFLHYTISESFGIIPVSFRAGRWAFCDAAAVALADLEYRVDSSVTPYVSWLNYQGPDYSDIEPDLFRFGQNGLEVRDSTAPLLEVPVSIGFLQKRQKSLRRIDKALKAPWARRLHLAGILERMKLLNLVWLSPEMSTAEQMKALANRMVKNGYSFLNLTFHSTSLKGGLSPFVKTVVDEDLFLKKLSSFLRVARDAGWESLTLAELEKTTSLRSSENQNFETDIILQNIASGKRVRQCS